jgi:hypothetical protein
MSTPEMPGLVYFLALTVGIGRIATSFHNNVPATLSISWTEYSFPISFSRHVDEGYTHPLWPVIARNRENMLRSVWASLPPSSDMEMRNLSRSHPWGSCSEVISELLMASLLPSQITTACFRVEELTAIPLNASPDLFRHLIIDLQPADLLFFCDAIYHHSNEAVTGGSWNTQLSCCLYSPEYAIVLAAGTWKR